MSLARLIAVRPWLSIVRHESSRSLKEENRQRSSYKYFLSFETRLRDNDHYGHVNNVVYGEWIDSVVNTYLISRCGLRPESSPLIGLVVSSHCQFFSPVSFPGRVSAGLRVDRMGNSSVDYLVGIFSEKEEKAAAVGGFTHVFVDRVTRRPRAIEEQMRKELLSISTS